MILKYVITLLLLFFVYGSGSMRMDCILLHDVHTCRARPRTSDDQVLVRSSTHHLDFGQHHLHQHPCMYTSLVRYPSALAFYDPPFGPQSFRPNLRVRPSPLLVHRAWTAHLTFSIAIACLTLNTCT